MLEPIRVMTPIPADAACWAAHSWVCSVSRIRSPRPRWALCGARARRPAERQGS